MMTGQTSTISAPREIKKVKMFKKIDGIFNPYLDYQLKTQDKIVDTLLAKSHIDYKDKKRKF